MTKTYRARLHGDRVEWLGESPPHSPDDTPVEIDILVPEKRAKVIGENPTCEAPDFRGSPDPERSRKLWTFFQNLPADRVSSFPNDVVAWQREIRQDRILPGRDE